MQTVSGLHHVTAIAGPAQENLDFYAGVLGMRLVKRSVNQDDPGTYHLFYADAEGHPGTDLTFFPWSQMAPSHEGHGLSSEVALAVPRGSHEFWLERLQNSGVMTPPFESRFGETVLPFRDPHGLRVALVEVDIASDRAFSAWKDSPIPEQHQIRGLHGARMIERDLARTAKFLTDALGFQHAGTENGWHRYAVADGQSGTHVDLYESPTSDRGRWGTGSIHHLAWRVVDEAHQLDVRERAMQGGARPTPVIDRFWFKSVYFPEPGGVLFELATDGPGFAVDEDQAHLGESLVLPPWLEPERRNIESVLPRLTMP
ncbi:MAG TPA: ring-cleaving dioxygenase [Chthoniobacterales bacterium]|jgi:glyoxalase family protein|nr:ring-cleaving dioxygenase [Chthoniobacterales bacterium]